MSCETEKWHCLDLGVAEWQGLIGEGTLMP